MSSTVRTFVALPVPPAAGRALAGLQERLRSGLAGRGEIRWVRPDQFHLTLLFIGERPRAELPSMAERLREAVAGFSAFSLALEGVGAFPGPSRPRVVWVGVSAGAASLVRLAAAVASALEPFAPAEAERDFHPHVTLGRVKWLAPGFSFAAWVDGCLPTPIGPQRLERVVLYASRLTPAGAQYAELAHVDLA